MLNRPSLPSFQRFPPSMRDLDSFSGLAGLPTPPMSAGAGPSSCASSNTASPPPSSTRDWRATCGDDMRRLRSTHVVLIERMLRNHQPHDVLSHVPENTDWRSRTFKLALKIERLMFKMAKSRADYLNEHTLQRRVKALCRYLVRMRMRKNAVAGGITQWS